MANKIILLLLACIIFACKSDENRLIGHWHEFPTDSLNTDFQRCFIINDSTISFDKFTLGGTLKISDFENGDFWLTTRYSNDLIRKKKINYNKIQFGDTLIWKKQDENLSTFIADFSANLEIEVQPPQSKNTDFDYLENKPNNEIKVHVGKLKNDKSNNVDNFLDIYHIQLGDIVFNLEDIKHNILCNHCDPSDFKILIHADKNAPKVLLDKLEKELLNVKIEKMNIYYLFINSKELLYGYSHSY